MAAERFAGMAYLKVDGRQYDLRGNFTVSPSRTERTGIAGLDRVHGFSEMPRVPFIEGDLSTTAGLSITDLENITNATVTAELANGKTFVLSQAWSKAAFEISAHEGQVRVRWEGVECREIS
jgi:hypothetical protein